MTPDLAPVSSPIALAPSKSRRATTMDRVRVRAFVRRLEAGEDEVDAFWAIASDPGTGMARYREATQRPPEIVLRRKLASLLERTAPGLLSAAKDTAVSRLAGMSDDALAAVRETVTGDFQDASHARARLDAARTILAALGIREQAPAAAASATVNLVSLGDGLRALRHVAAEVREVPDGGR